MKNNDEKKIKRKYGCLLPIVSLIVIFALIGAISSCFSSGSDDIGSNKAATTESINENEPDKIELMSYAQTVLDDYYPSAKYSRNKDEYNCVGSYPRYKVEGEVSVDGMQEYQPFYMIMEFSDETYTEYELISLQVGDEVLYEQ